MRELTLKEVEEVGGGYFEDIMESWGFGSAAGSVYGYAVKGTVAAATRFGLWGGAIGFAWGLGQMIGTAAYNKYGDYIYYKYF